MGHIEKRYRKDDSIISRRIGEEYILVPIRHDVAGLESVYTLNEVGAFIWNQIDGNKSVKDLTDGIAEEFEIKVSQAEEDLVEFLQEMEEIHAVVLVE